MTASEPHPLRCETCKRDHTDHLCRYTKTRLSESLKEFLEVVGCASHSAAQQERERVLDEMLNQARKFAAGDIASMYPMYPKEYHEGFIKALERVDRELRSRGGGEG